jgi:Spy/CpxP family protein refolding chaperone
MTFASIAALTLSLVQASPYAGQEARAIKALAPEEIAQYRDGAGMGLARAAELNHHPGPRHVLELATELELAPVQAAAVRASFERMQAAARRLGSRIVDGEAALDRAFAGGQAEERRVRRLVAEIARLQGELRAAHLLAHVETRRILTAHQVEVYERLRGYGGAAGHSHHPAR